MRRYSYTPGSSQGAKRQLIYGLVLVAIGVVITVGTYTWSSQQGGTYFISFGPIIFGLIRILTAVPVLLRSRGRPPVPPGLVGPPFTGPPSGAAGTWGAGQRGSMPGAGASWGPAAGAGTSPWAASPPPAQASAPVDFAPAPIAGWYADPSGASQLRWWDGIAWTGHTRANE